MNDLETTAGTFFMVTAVKTSCLTWTYPHGNAHNRTGHGLTDWRRHSSALDVQSFRAADCDTDHCPAAARTRERLAVNKQTSHRFRYVQSWEVKRDGE
jgi:hypothetical protein